jgi:hypothetical protein
VSYRIIVQSCCADWAQPVRSVHAAQGAMARGLLERVPTVLRTSIGSDVYISIGAGTETVDCLRCL